MKYLKTKTVVFALMSLIGFSGCESEVEQFPFTEKELDFVSYEKNEEFKVIDTSGVLQVIKQREYDRRLVESSGFLIIAQEKYDVKYWSDGVNRISLSVYIGARIDEHRGGDLAIRMIGMVVFANPNTLPQPVSSIIINGINYKNVHVLKAKPEYIDVPWQEATFYWNRQYGFIQLLLPNGKTITRTD